jgi:hypothetical protein
LTSTVKGRPTERLWLDGEVGVRSEERFAGLDSNGGALNPIESELAGSGEYKPRLLRGLDLMAGVARLRRPHS